MKNKSYKIILILMIMLLAMSALVGCNNNNNDDVVAPIGDGFAPILDAKDNPLNNNSGNVGDIVDIVVASINGQDIYMSEYTAMWNNVKAQYGIDESILNDEKYAEDLLNLRHQVLDVIIQEIALDLALNDKGYMDLNQADMQLSIDEAQAQVDYYVEMSQEEIKSSLVENYTDKDLQNATDDFINSLFQYMGVADMNALVDTFVLNKAIQNAKDELVDPSIEPSEEELVEMYDAYLAADTAEFENNPIGYCDNATGIESQVFFAPEGVRTVRQVLIILDDESLNKINELRMAQDNDAADKALEEALLTIEEEANMALTQLKTNEITFIEAIAEFNDDEGMDYYTQGYYVCDGYTGYVQSFTDASMALENNGDFSNLVPSDYGYHIIEYYQDIPAGPVAYEDVRQELYDEIQPMILEEAWYEIVNEWGLEYGAELHYDLIEDVQ